MTGLESRKAVESTGQSNKFIWQEECLQNLQVTAVNGKASKFRIPYLKHLFEGWQHNHSGKQKHSFYYGIYKEVTTHYLRLCWFLLGKTHIALLEIGWGWSPMKTFDCDEREIRIGYIKMFPTTLFWFCSIVWSLVQIESLPEISIICSMLIKLSKVRCLILAGSATTENLMLADEAGMPI